jgi:hypothetical protein
MVGASNLYLVWYGCWDNNCGGVDNTVTQSILLDFAVNVWLITLFSGSRGLSNGYGQGPSGALLVGGALLINTRTGLS